MDSYILIPNMEIQEDVDSSKLLLKLFETEMVENINDALAIQLHAFMLETGFIPVSQNDSSNDYMPQKWKSSGIYKIQYFHKCCPEMTCWMTCISMGTLMIVHGTLEKVQSADVINIQLKIKDFVNQKELSDTKSIANVYECSEELSRIFKDSFCYSLLTSIQNYAGFNRIFGLTGLFEDIKCHILGFLPATSVVAISAVNKEFHHLANSNSLWRHLFIQDYAKKSDGVLDASAEAQQDIDYKDLYRKEFTRRLSLKKRTSREFDGYRPMRRFFNPLNSWVDDDDVDMRIDMDPDVQRAFPYLRDRSRGRRNPLFEQFFPMNGMDRFFRF